MDVTPQAPMQQPLEQSALPIEQKPQIHIPPVTAPTAPTASSQGASARVYLNDNVTPALLDGMRLLVKER